MIYLISPTISVAQCWAKQLDISPKDYRIITKIESTNGVIFTLDNTIFIEGELFDYPELSDEYIKVSNFIKYYLEVRL